ncbi:MAG: M48 family metallopeptidase [Zoogloeaceae bacterium]|nr:M48 family metallopeptidase [Zoogloeaceae bacterium]
MTASAFTLLFAMGLALATGLRVWLATRQIRHVEMHRGQVPDDFSATVSLAAHQRAADYTVGKMRLARWHLLMDTVLLLSLTLGGGVQVLHELWASQWPAGGLAHGVGLIASVGVIGWLVGLPFSWFRTFSLEARFGFNRMTQRLFWSDTVRQAALAAVLGLPILAGLLWVIDAAGQHWWLYAWACWMALNLGMMVIWPTFIAPLFNRFDPLADGETKGRVEALLTRCGFRSNGLFVMDGSRRSAHGNAYFTGLGAAKRIVFFDTLLDKLGPTEIEAVLAHELGHFRHHHVVKRLVVLGGAFLGFFALLAWLAGQPWFFHGLGVSAQDTPTALVLFAEVLPVLLFPLAPLLSLWSRRHEFQADHYAATHANPGDLISALLKLYRDNASTLTPDPIYSSVNDSHPPAAQRVAQLRRWQEAGA